MKHSARITFEHDRHEVEIIVNTTDPAIQHKLFHLLSDSDLPDGGLLARPNPLPKKVPSNPVEPNKPGE